MIISSQIAIGIGGFFVGLIVLFGLYVGTMALYFRFRKRNPSSKLSVEILFIAIAFLVSFLIKFIIEVTVAKKIAETEDMSFGESIAAFFYAVYGAVGGLTFEGLPYGVLALKNGILSALFMGSSVYAGLIVVSLISARASYEFYSFLYLFFFGEKDGIYVFTALNEESITMAESIADSVKDTPREKYVRIVFAGPSLPPFDRKEALCRRVMADGFLYWTYSEDKEESIARILHLDNHNNDTTRKDYNAKYKDRDFFIFAFDSKDHVPEEEDNLEIVLRDIDARRQRPDDLRINYFILTKRKVNYQAYQSIIDRVKTVVGEGEDLPSVINLWNEAQEVAKIAVQKIMTNGLIDDLCREEEKGVYVWSLGFGGTGEAITNELFVQTPGVANGKSRPYAVNVFDSNLEEATEIFRATHESYEFLENPSWKALTAAAMTASEQAKGMPAPVYGLHKLRKNKNELYAMKDEILGVDKDSLVPDVITISTGDDYRNISYANTIAQWIVNDRVAHPEKKRGLRHIVVSVFDEDNNNLLTTFNEKPAPDDDPRILSIHDQSTVKMDEKNVSVVGDCFLKIIIVNNLKDVYSFRHYKTNFDAAASKNYTYSLIADGSDDSFKQLTDLANTTIFNEASFVKMGEEFEKTLQEIAKEKSEEMAPVLATIDDPNENKLVSRINGFLLTGKGQAKEGETADRKYNKIVMWDKESNRSVVYAEPFYEKYFGDRAKALIRKFGTEPLTGAEQAARAKAMYDWKEHAAEVEHDRWVRFHLADGWEQFDSKNKERKQHTCIVSYEELKKGSNAWTIVFDVMNVLWAMGDDRLLKN